MYRSLRKRYFSYHVYWPKMVSICRDCITIDWKYSCTSCSTGITTTEKDLLYEVTGISERVSCTAYSTESRNHCQSCEVYTCTTETNSTQPPLYYYSIKIGLGVGFDFPGLPNDGLNGRKYTPSGSLDRIFFHTNTKNKTDVQIRSVNCSLQIRLHPN